MSTVQLQVETPNPDQVLDNPSLPPSTNHGHEPPSEGPSDNSFNFLIQARRLLHDVIEFIVRLPNDDIQTSVETFLKTCDSNPLVAVLVAAPIVFSALISVSFIIGSVISLLLWVALTVSVAALCVIVGGLLSLLTKLHVVLWRSIPEGRFSGAINTTTQATTASARYLMTTTDWQSIMQSIARGGLVTYNTLSSALSQTFAATSTHSRAMYSDYRDAVVGTEASTSAQESPSPSPPQPDATTEIGIQDLASPFISALLGVYKVVSTISLAIYSVFQRTMMYDGVSALCRAIYTDVQRTVDSMQHIEANRNTAVRPEPSTSAQAPLHKTEETTSQGEGRPEQFGDAIEEENSERIDIKPIDISNIAKDSEGSAKGLKQRTPFTRLEG